MKPWLAVEKQNLYQQLKDQSLPHALLISGVKNSGKQALGDWLGNLLLCQNLYSSEHHDPSACHQCKACNLFKLHTHPDFKRVELTSKSIGVDQIRQASRLFEKTAQLGQNQVVIIEDADSMTESAANALLKTLEEPTNNSFILLLVTDQQRLLPTLISRCRHISLKPPIGEALIDSSGLTLADPFLNLSYLHEVTDEETFNQFNRLTNMFILYLFEANNRMSLLSVLLQNKESGVWLERIMINLIRQQNDWVTIPHINSINPDELLSFVVKNKENLWQIYLLIKRYNKQNYTLSQLNQEYAMEKLLVGIKQLIYKYQEQ